jgi:hypothetical protein
MNRLISILFGILLLCGCSGGSEFVPDNGPFNGSFTDAGGTGVGAFSYTVFDGTLQGTGILNHNGSNITVTISASHNGKVINGTVNNSTFGSGPIWGTFTNLGLADGGFTFTGNAGVATTTGTWSASLP